MDGLYVHIPFCVSKCKYCDFASFAGKEHLTDKYINAVCNEMQKYKGHKFDTVYIGGGTPTVLESNAFEQLFDSIYNNFKIAQGSEITVEANPKTVDAAKANVLKDVGVNRVSLGAQSMNDDELKMLGRIHTAYDTEQTVDIIKNSGIHNISLDLMYALPGQTTDKINKSVSKVLSLKPEHISCYGLKIEQGTPFYDMKIGGKITELDDDATADMYELIIENLGKNGYQHYEISNFAKPGSESKHNTKYWKCVDYIGLGLGASSCLDGARFTNSCDFDSYFNGYQKSEEYTLTQSEKMSEFIILGLRLIKIGVSKKEFAKKFNTDIYKVFGKIINKHIANGLLCDNGESLVLTPRAYYICNYVMSDFVNNM